MALEIRHLQRSEVREAEEPFPEGNQGSSAMPHKRNPHASERICGLARLVRGYAMTALENIALWHERDISHSSTERVIFPDACIVLDFMLAELTELIAGLVVYPERMLANLNASGGVVYLAACDAGAGRCRHGPAVGLQARPGPCTCELGWRSPIQGCDRGGRNGSLAVVG